LWAPELNSEDFGGKKAFYDFSTRPIVDQLGGGTDGNVSE
jgi:hypothetical protein